MKMEMLMEWRPDRDGDGIESEDLIWIGMRIKMERRICRDGEWSWGEEYRDRDESGGRMGMETGIWWNHETSLGISSTFRFLSLVCFGSSIFCRVIPILASITPFPFGCLLSLLCKCLFRLGLWLWRSRFSDNLVDLLCGLSFTLALFPLASPSVFLLGKMAEGLRC